MSWCRSTRARASNTSRHFAPSISTPAIIGTKGPGGKEASVFNSSAIKQADSSDSLPSRGELLSWLFFLGTGLGPFSGQACISSLRPLTASTTPSTDIAARRTMAQLAGRDNIVGSDYTIVDMSAWGSIDRASRVMKGADDPLAPFPNVQQWFTG
jgi:GST-like protein